MSRPLVIVMGVSGSGKTTIGERLASHWEIPYHDADDFHPRANVAKMEKGQPLTDEDRLPWLRKLNGCLRQWSETGAVLGCSALKSSYRDLLTHNLPTLRWVHLAGSRELIMARMQARSDHFMPASLLDSQFEALEPPKDALQVSIDQGPEEIVEEIIQRW